MARGLEVITLAQSELTNNLSEFNLVYGNQFKSNSITIFLSSNLLDYVMELYNSFFFFQKIFYIFILKFK